MPTDTRPTTAPRRRHLMDPNAPRQQRDPEAIKRLDRVQRRVASILVMTTTAHLAAGMILAAVVDAGGSDRGIQIGLIVIGALFWSVGVGAVLALNRRSPLSWWHLTSFIPAAIGLGLILG